MAGGINENIHILGRVLHVQTEHVPGDAPVIRTTVYDGGRIVAARETPVGEEQTAEHEILEQIRRQHRLIVDNIVNRSAELAERRNWIDSGMAAAAVETEPAPHGAAVVRTRHPLPAGSDPSLRRALRTRRLVGAFSHQFAPAGHLNRGVESTLESAGHFIDSIMGSPSFRGLRVDEQVRFFDLKERIDRWRSDPDRAPDHELVADIEAFALHLQAINQRRELTAFDHRLLLWALGSLGSGGVSVEIVTHLESLRGRDPRLDGLLDTPAAITAEELVSVLICLLDRTVPETDPVSP